MIDKNKKQIEQFVNYLSSKNKSPGTIKIYKSHLNQFFENQEKDYAQISISDLNEYINSKDKEIAKKSKGWELFRNQLSSKTKNLFYSTISQFYYFCGKKAFSREIMEGRIKEGSRGHREPVMLTIKEIQMLLNTPVHGAEILQKRDNLVVRFLFGTGMREAELCNLTINDLKLDIPFNKGETRRIISIVGKGNKERSILFSKKLLDDYGDYLNEFSSNYVISSSLFTTFRNTPLKEYTIYNIVKGKAIKAGIIRHKKAISPHKLRSTFCTTLHANQEDLLNIQELMGHASPATTKFYVGVDKQSLIKIKTPDEALR